MWHRCACLLAAQLVDGIVQACLAPVTPWNTSAILVGATYCSRLIGFKGQCVILSVLCSTGTVTFSVGATVQTSLPDATLQLTRVLLYKVWL
jgi:hypothetical protein